MKTITRWLIIMLLQTLCITSYAQEAKLKRANKDYSNLAYIDAAEIYLKVANSGYKSEELFKKLGNTYYFNANYEEAAKWYAELFALNSSVKEAEYYLRYAQSLKAIGKDEQSKQWFNSYIKKAGITDKMLQSAKDYQNIILENSGRYDMKALNINTHGIDFGGTLFGDKLVFASTKDTTSLFKKRSTWDGLSFLDLYEAEINADGTLEKPTKLKGDVNTKFHESSAVFTKDGKTMYFTRSNVTPKVKRGKEDVRCLKIYRAHLIDNKWTNVEDLSINGDNYSTAHPALSPDENILYFASDMPKTLGGSDLFMVRINPDGSLGQVANLGEKINTKGRESFPYVTKDNELYFSSDGHYGLGGYDVFYSQINDNSSFGDLLNVGSPVNSPYDDVTFTINNGKGFVSSNRKGGQGYDDIYSFVETKDIKSLLKSRVFGIVKDKRTNEPLSNATVALLDDNNKLISELKTDSRGYYQFEADYNSSYVLKATKPEYSSADAYAQKNIREREFNFELTKEITAVDNGDDLANVLNIIIYFDFDKSIIRPDAEAELEKLVVAMKDHPGLKVDIRSHTDSRGVDRYNLALSERRAQATLNYLVSRGISKSKLTAKGYGETQLVNGCSNGVKCTDEQHEANRRSEFIINN